MVWERRGHLILPSSARSVFPMSVMARITLWRCGLPVNIKSAGFTKICICAAAGQNNTDAGLSVEKQNRNDFYKDKLRYYGDQERRKLNK